MSNNVESIKSELVKLADNDILSVILSGDTDKVKTLKEQDIYDMVTQFTQATSVVLQFLESASIGSEYNPYKRPRHIATMFYHHVWSQFSTMEAIKSLYAKGKREEEYFNEIIKQFVHDIKEIYNFLILISNGETPDTITLYNNKEAKTYKAVDVVTYSTKIVKS